MNIEFNPDRWEHYYSIVFYLKSESGMTEEVELSTCTLSSLRELWEDGEDRGKFCSDFRKLVDEISDGSISCDDISDLEYFDEDEVETVYISSIVLNEHIYDNRSYDDDYEEVSRVDFPNPSNEVMF